MIPRVKTFGVNKGYDPDKELGQIEKDLNDYIGRNGTNANISDIKRLKERAMEIYQEFPNAKPIEIPRFLITKPRRCSPDYEVV